MKYNEEMRKKICAEAAGKTIESLEWVDDSGGYWVVTFTDGSEMCFNRFMAEVVN